MGENTNRLLEMNPRELEVIQAVDRFVLNDRNMIPYKKEINDYRYGGKVTIIIELTKLDEDSED